MEELQFFLNLVIKFFNYYFSEIEVMNGLPIGVLIIAPILFKIVMNSLVLKAKSVGRTARQGGVSVERTNVQSKDK